MLSPTPTSLFCALLLCLPLVILFTFTATPTATTSCKPCHASSSAFIQIIINTTAISTLTPNKTTSSTIHNKTTGNSMPLLELTAEVQKKPQNESIAAVPFSPPPNFFVVDEDGDDSVFRLAARVDAKPVIATAQKKKLAFMFLTTRPLPFAPLWEIYFNATPKDLYNIYVHADPSFNYSPPFQGVFLHRVIPSKPTRRHTPTLVSAARRLLSHALLHDPANHMFALLSDSCIPLHSFRFTYKTLIKSKKSFIEILKDEIGAYDRWAARGEEAMLPEVKFDNFRIGSQFFVMTRRHARIVVRDRRLWSKFKLPCINPHTCYPEEQYFPTLLSMVDPRGCVGATLTHVDWKDRHDGHPHTYCVDEVGPDLIRALRNGRPRYGEDRMNGSDLSVTHRHDPFLFARKFCSEVRQPLIRMAANVIFKD